MIKIFRNIRRTLLSTGKFSNYFKYAVGEILLVVIGILIALQINNWNEHRKEQARLHSYTLSLINDLARDTTMINERLEGLSALYEINERVKKHMNSKDATLDTLVKIAKTEFSPMVSNIEHYNSNSFNSIISTGTLELFKTPIKNALLAHQQLQESSLDQSIFDIYFSKVNDLTRYFPIIKHPQSFAYQDNSYLQKQLDNIPDERKFVSLFVNVVNYKGLMLVRYRDGYKEVLESTKRLITLLKKNTP